jgi:6-pyruvoyltetrahydropterin/6-carboxytetrahydropterin synthase
MFTCSKTYTDIPFAHRQHRHGGHCALVHGHNWRLRFTFACERLDENAFVVDFGQLRYIREWIDRTLDHACLFNADDPLREALVAAAPGAWKPPVVENCSAEGIAKFVFETVDPMVREHTASRAWLESVEVSEDSRNSARYAPGARG